MSWELALQLIETVAVVIGVIFGLIQLRQLRIQREVQAGIELLRPLQSPQAAEALLSIHNLPSGLREADLRRALGTSFGSVLGVLALFESLGPLVARGHVPFDMYADSYRGVTVLSWRKMRPYVEEQRGKGWPNLFEWLQWLAERLDERAPAASDIPAFQRFKNWSGGGDYERLHDNPHYRNTDAG